jgi:hypothetical protein
VCSAPGVSSELGKDRRMTERITLDLTKAEALVLFELLTRVDNAEALSYEDPAEQEVLWNIEGQLERKLVEPLDPNYPQLLADARKLVRGA